MFQSQFVHVICRETYSRRPNCREEPLKPKRASYLTAFCALLKFFNCDLNPTDPYHVTSNNDGESSRKFNSQLITVSDSFRDPMFVKYCCIIHVSVSKTLQTFSNGRPDRFTPILRISSSSAAVIRMEMRKSAKIKTRATWREIPKLFRSC